MDDAVTNPTSPPEIPQYSPALFAARQDEIAWMRSQVQDLLADPARRGRTINYWGARGSGKSWFLLHLARARYNPGPEQGETGNRLSDDPRVHSLYLNLDDFEGRAPEDRVRHLVWALRDHLAGWLGHPATGEGAQNASASEWSTWLAQDVEELLEGSRLVLLLDHVSEQSPAFREELEDRVLAPLAALPGLMLVMAERGSGYSWKHPALHYWAQHRDLPLFDSHSTGEQLERLRDRMNLTDAQIEHLRAILEDEENVLPRSGGCPLANYLLALGATMDDVVDEVLGDIPNEERRNLEALCVLNFWFEDHVPIMLAAYLDDPTPCQQPERASLEQILALVARGYVRWDDDRRGYTMDPSVCSLLRARLLEAEPDRWQRLQCAAYRLNRGWQTNLSGTASRWQQEASHHGSELGDRGYDPEDDCPPRPCPEDAGPQEEGD